MLTIAVGVNGSGKSLWAMDQLVKELRRTNRQIVTTLAVDMGRLNEFLQKHYPKETIDVAGRILCIGKNEITKFWRYRGVDKAWGEYGPEPIVRGPFGDESWSVIDGGVCYIIDEAQVGFNARNWQKVGTEFCDFQSQHRKLTSDVIAITPASGLLDKQFRLLAGECVLLTNLYQKSVSIWKAPRKIVYQVFGNCPPLPGETHSHKGSIYIDPEGLAGCYRTQDGVGIVGGEADKGRESKGIPWYYAFGLALVLALAGWWVAGKLMRFGVDAGSRALSTSAPVVALTNMPGFAALGATLSSHTGGVVGASVLVDKIKSATPLPSKEEIPIATGWCRVGGVCEITDEEGRGIRGTNLVVQGRYVFLDGVKFDYRRKVPEVPVVMATVPARVIGAGRL